jgi:UDP-glucose:(heptosyl)LPS alpha-1,3-glucosyltransferase
MASSPHIIIPSGWMSTLASARNLTVRIAITIEKLDTRRGGAEINAARLIQQLVARGHEVHVLTESVAAELPASVQVHPIPARGGFVSLRQWSFTSGVARFLREHSFDATVACQRGYVEDIVWAQDISYPSTVEGMARSYYYSPLRQALRRRQPRFSLKAWIYGDIERRQFTRRPPPYLIAVSHMAARTFIEDYSLNPDRVRVVHNQIDFNRFSSDSLQAKRPTARQALGVRNELVILFVGQTFRRKGVRPLVEAAGLLRQQRTDFRVVIVGLGARQAEPYQRLAQRLSCAEQVSFRDESKQVQGWFAAADVFCLPSFYDSFGMVVLEAMTAGLPVVISQYCGVAELLHPGVDGFVVQRPQDAAEIAGQILPLFESDRRRSVAVAARETARKTFEANAQNEIGKVVEDLAAIVMRRSPETSGAA